MKIAHESPLSIFDTVDELTDYSYALVHLFEESEEYKQKFIHLSNAGREIILDNSAFELETVFDADRYIEWINIIKPTWYIIPDALNDKDTTIAQFDNWMTKYDDAPGLKIVVPQGKTIDEYFECYLYMEPYVDKVGITFDPVFFKNQYNVESGMSIAMFYAEQRVRLINYMVNNGIINTDKKHHLLGCGVPQEFLHYKGMSFFDSVDTSNPVVHGYYKKAYEDHGLDDKISIKLHTLINAEVSQDKLDIIISNIKSFRKFCNS